MDEITTKHVAIFGAGITGLTAAHELIERGYYVEVYEPTAPSPFETVCGIGGMARTQWWRAERQRDPEAEPKKRRRVVLADEEMPVELERKLEQTITFHPKDSTTLDAEAMKALDTIACLLKRYQWLRHIEIRGYSYDRDRIPYGDHTGIEYQRAVAVKEYLEKAKVPTRLDAVSFGLGYRDNWTKSDEERCYVDFHTIEDWIPGEHGFRFFPAFYHNLRDTMRRIPIPEDKEIFVETPWTVHDNIVATTSQGINLEGGRSYVLPRKRVTSIQKMFDVLCDSLAGSEFTFRDMALVQVKLFKYITSCPERRADYENLSWWDFVEGDRYSPQFQKYLDIIPQNLVAMEAQECDARTYGNMQTQILLDQFTEGENTDGTLNGPSNFAWFDHWRRYLETQGVVFRRGRLVGFEIQDEHTLWPVVFVEEESEPGSGSFEYRCQALVRDYYVVALPLEEIHRLTCAQPALQGDDFDSIRAFDVGDASDPTCEGVLHPMSGIQFYFPSEIKSLPGHIVYPDSKWGLSSIFQPQFWTTKRGWWDGYRGILSVDICDFDVASKRTGKSAWDSTRDEIKEEIWQQITDTIPDTSKIAEPFLYHIDENLLFNRGAGPHKLPSENLTRMLINLPGMYAQRPGKPGRYQLQYDRLVLAGTYMQTYFRLTTMESANESARHAVNAILDRDGFKGDRCFTWNPEAYEAEDLRYFIDLDRELYNQKLPHFLDILGLEKLPESWLGKLPDLSALGLPPLWRP